MPLISQIARIIALLSLFLVVSCGPPLGPRSDRQSASAQVIVSRGWERESPEAAGLDGAMLARLTSDIRAGVFPNIHSLLVVRKGKLVVEEYFEGNDERRGRPLGYVHFDAATLHDLRSVTKSVTSIVFGVAVAEGVIDSIDVPVLDFFPEYTELRTPERLSIRLRHLLSMTSGLQWNESSRPYSDPLNSESAMDRAQDRYRFVLEQLLPAFASLDSPMTPELRKTLSGYSLAPALPTDREEERV